MIQTLTITGNNIDSIYKDTIYKVLYFGDQVEARGLKFKEILFSHIILTNPRARIVQNTERNISKKFMIAEFIWIMSGQNSLDMISFYNKNYSQFSDDGKTLHGAYGPRLRNWNGFDQLTNCLERLENDKGSRQSVAVILDPGKDFTEKTKDIPCNDLLQFFIRDNKLHMSCYVRSNDINWGFPYDIFHWAMLQEMFASILDVELGEYHHFVGSFHIYDKDYKKMEKCLSYNDAHIPMQKMPKLYDLSILNTLKNMEHAYRVVGVDDPWIGVNQYWNDLFSMLKK